MSRNEFESQYLGRFEGHKGARAIEQLMAKYMRKKDSFAAAHIGAARDAIRHGGDPDECVRGLIESLSESLDHLHSRLIEAQKVSPAPVLAMGARDVNDY